jgi:K+-transporting ATPase ATPase C chain
MFLRESIIAVRVTIVTLVVTGFIYPAVVTVLAQTLFPHNSGGSLLYDEKGTTVVGSELIGQTFTKPGYFQGRPSAAGAGYDPQASGGSNLGPTSKKLHDRVEVEVKRLKTENPDADKMIPAELVTASASGLDPHLSKRAALWQVPRIAKARNVASDRIERLVADHVEHPDLGILGEERINVLALNLALDQQFPMQ